MLLPSAVQTAREAARRSQCAKRMKQISLAMHMFHDANKMLPYARGSYMGNNGLGPMAEWTTNALPATRYPAVFYVLLMDGSGRFVGDSVELATWQALGTIAGNEVMSGL